ncbi:MAG TPA: ribonuclease [Psychrobacter sp.]|nr:ribonuclease [Psychrobacter sp.]
MEMSRQRLRPSLEESTGYICPRCHGNGMIRDLRSLSLSIMRQIEQIALKERQGEVQAEVPTDIAAFLLNEKRDSLVYLEQDSGTRITILPHAHLESPNFKLHFNRDGFAPSSYERITDTQQQEHSDLGYNVDWQTADSVRPEQQPTRQPRQVADNGSNKNSQATPRANSQQQSTTSHSNDHRSNANVNASNVAARAPQPQTQSQSTPTVATTAAPVASQNNNATAAQPQAVAWLSNLFAQAPQASTTPKVSSRDAAEAIEALVNTGAQSLGSFGQIDNSALDTNTQAAAAPQTSSNQQSTEQQPNTNRQQAASSNTDDNNDAEDRRRRKPRKSRPSKTRQRKEQSDESNGNAASNNVEDSRSTSTDDKQADSQDKRQHDNRRPNDRNRNNRQDSGRNGNENSNSEHNDAARKDANTTDEQTRAKRKSNSQRSSRGKIERGETLSANNEQSNKETSHSNDKNQTSTRRNQDPNEVVLQVNEAATELKSPEVVHLSLDDSKSVTATRPESEKRLSEKQNSDKASDKTESEKAPQEDSRPKNTEQPKTDEQSTDKQGTNDQPAKSTGETVDSSPKTSTQTVTADAAKSDNAQNDKAESVDTVLAAVQTDDAKTSTTEDKVQNSDANSVDERNVEATKPAADEQSTSKSRSAVKTSDKADDVAPTEAQKTAADVDANTDNTDSSNQAAFEIDHEALFAKRYVTAEKFGQASNDPRVVRRQQAQVSSTTTSNEQTPVVNEQRAVNVPAIRGTVGEFIRATLPEAQARLAAEGVINCFNAAIALHLEQANAVNVKVDSNNESKVETGKTAKQDFDFSNYGYEPLAADYLARFEAMTQAVSQFAAAQGKTAVQPRPISKRASNDPRGQHPDYQEPAATTVAEAAKKDALAANSNADADINVDAQNVDATALANQSQTEDVSADSEELLKVEQALEAENAEQPEVNAVEADNVEVANTEAKDADSDVEQSENEQASESTEQLSEQATKEEIQAAKSKTTIASYKNMIENVAEQLLPQKGMFNLTTPKVPKARTRKPKAEHKKPTQAEKSENDDSDSES